MRDRWTILIALLLLLTPDASWSQATTDARPPSSQEPRARSQEPRAERPAPLQIVLVPGAQEHVVLRLEESQLLRRRVDELLARDGGGTTITRLAVAVYRLPGVVREAPVLAFYQNALRREMAGRGANGDAQLAKASGAHSRTATPGTAGAAAPTPPSGIADGSPSLSQWRGGQGLIAVTVQADPSRPRDTRVVVVRVEGTPPEAVQGLLRDLSQIAVDIGSPLLRATELAGSLPLLGGVPTFPGIGAPSLNVRLNPAEIQTLAQRLAADGSYPPRTRQLIAGLLKQARSVSLRVQALPRGATGRSVAAFYAQELTKAGAKPVIPPDLSDVTRPLLIYRLPDDAGLMMIRAYPQVRPSLVLGGRLAPSPNELAISFLQIEGVSALGSRR